MTIAHVVLVWALAACAWLEYLYAVLAIAVLHTALVAVSARRNMRLIEQAEGAQRAASERQMLAALIETSAALAAIVDNHGRVVHSNQRFRDVLDCAARPADALANPLLKGVDKLTAFAASGQAGPIEVDLEFERPHDQKLMLHVSASRQVLPVSGDCVVLIGHDETLRHRAQQSLAQAAKLATLGELTSGIAHELSQPLNVIRMAAQNVLIEAAPGGELEGTDGLDIAPIPDDAFRVLAASKLQRIVTQVDRAAAIIARMRIFSRSSQTGAREFDVRDACEASLSLVAAQFRRAGITAIRDFGEEPVMTMGHESFVQQAVVSLLVNARDALAESHAAIREVRVSVRCDDSRIRVQVRDNGPGIPADIRHRIFEPFFTTKPIGHNTGLGLSLAYGAMRDVGGELRLLPEGPGATFEMELPVRLPSPIEHTADSPV